jgi:hypothetical protein
VAVNDYIARGGSGFLVLKRNTTRIETGIPLRDSLIGFMGQYCSCDEVLAGRTDGYGNLVGARGQACGNRDPAAQSHWIVEEQERSFCAGAKQFKDELLADRSGCTCADVFRGNADACSAGGPLADQKAQCLAQLSAGPTLGRCACREALAGDVSCGFVTAAMRNFCENPTSLPVAIGAEDGRIQRRVK